MESGITRNNGDGGGSWLPALRLYQRGMAEPYCNPSELSLSSRVFQSGSHGQLSDVALAHIEDRPRRIWEYDLELTPKQVVVAIALVTVGLVVMLALLVAAAQGFNSVLSHS